MVANKRPVYVPNIHKHGHVYFFIPEHSHEQEVMMYNPSLSILLSILYACTMAIFTCISSLPPPLPPSPLPPLQYHGSLVVVPILSVTGGVVGTISIDCVSLVSKPRQSFEDHEIAFYQVIIYLLLLYLHVPAVYTYNTSTCTCN